MPISSAPTSTSSLGPAAGLMTPGSANPFASLSLPGFNFKPVDRSSLDVSQSGVLNMLAQQPQSVINTLLPGLMQIYGLQGNAMLPFFQSQTGQMMATAQSDAAKRGLTGSSIEAASILGAQSAGQQQMNQFLAQMLEQLGQSYSGAVRADVNAANSQTDALAQALGQAYAQNISQLQFAAQQNFESGQADANRHNALTGAMIGAGGSIIGGALGGGAMRFSDIRLKEHVKKVGKVRGLNLYVFSYRRKEHPDLGLTPGMGLGFLAHEVARKYPEAVALVKGFLAIDFAKLARLTAEAA